MDNNAIRILLENTAVQQRFASLRARWTTESAYEDIADYEQVLQSVMPDGVVVVRMLRSPFAADVMVGGTKYRIAMKRARGGYAFTAREVK